MNSAKIRVWLDEKLQIVRQEIEGAMTLEDFEHLIQETDACRQRLRDPQNLRILVEGTRMENTDFKVRKRGLEIFTKPEMRKMAVYGVPLPVCVMMTMMSMVTKKNCIRAFKTEDEALHWLAK